MIEVFFCLYIYIHDLRQNFNSANFWSLPPNPRFAPPEPSNSKNNRLLNFKSIKKQAFLSLIVKSQNRAG